MYLVHSEPVDVLWLMLGAVVVVVAVVVVAAAVALR